MQIRFGNMYREACLMDQPRSLSATAELDLRWYGHHAGFFF